MATFNFTSFGAENLFLGGDDDARVNNVSTFNTSDSISGAAGSDNVLFINCPTPLTMVTGPNAYAGIQGIERISIFSDQRHVIVLDDSFLSRNGVDGELTVFGFDVLGSRIDGSALTGNHRLFVDAGFGPDTILGGSGVDSLGGYDANDVINGGAGDDTLSGDRGNDTVDGGAGIDEAQYDDSDAAVSVNLATGIASDGLGGTDLLIDIEEVEGSDFNDLLIGNAGVNKLQGKDGADTLFGGEGGDSLQGGSGADQIYGDIPGAGDDSVDGGQGADTAFGGGGNDTMNGGEDADLLVGDLGNDVLNGDGGNDVIFGGAGNDQVAGNDGVDFLFGDAGPDALDGGAGNDRLHVDAQDTLAQAGEGIFDILVFTSNAGGLTKVDLGNAENQNETGSGPVLQGFEGVDASVATAGVEVDGFAFNGFGNVLFGSTFADTIRGSGAADIILGNGGADILIGGNGADTIIADAGNDTMTGGSGQDVFFYSGGAQAGAVRIADFSAADDTIGLGAGFNLTPGQALAQTAQVGNDAVLNLGSGRSITFTGVDVDNLSAADFQVF